MATVFLLRPGDGGYPEWHCDAGWFARALLLAEAHGWEPERPWTPHGRAALIHPLDGWQVDLSVSEASAHHLAEVLRRVNHYVQQAEEFLRRPLNTAIPQEPSDAAVRRRLLEVLADPDSQRSLATLAGFCERGGFRVRWPFSPPEPEA